MKALTLRHPWPFAIAYLGKDTENRDWDDRMVGLTGLPQIIERSETVAIHGGAAPVRPKRAARSPENPWVQFVADLNALRDLMDGKWPEPALEYLAERAQGRPVQPEDFIMPGIVATCTITSTTRASRSRWAIPGQLHLQLGHVTRIEPVQVGGAQGLWAVPDVVAAEVRARANAARDAEPRRYTELEGREWLGL